MVNWASLTSSPMPWLCSDALQMCSGIVPDVQIRFILHSGLAPDALGLLETWLLLSNIYIMLLWAGYRTPRLSSGALGLIWKCCGLQSVWDILYYLNNTIFTFWDHHSFPGSNLVAPGVTTEDSEAPSAPVPNKETCESASDGCQST